MQIKIDEPETEQGPPQKAPGYDDTNSRRPEHDPAIDDPDPGGDTVTDPDTEGQMGQPEDDGEEDNNSESNFSVGG